MEKLFFTIEKGGERIDKYLSEQLEDMTRSHIQKLIKEKVTTFLPKS